MAPATPQFEAALRIVETLRAAGHEAYFAGGCVRDLLLGRDPVDYDVATSATPDVVLEMFPRTFAVGAHFGVVLVASEAGSDCEEGSVAERCVTEVATFRSDGAYSDGRHPDAGALHKIRPRRRAAARLHHQRAAARPDCVVNRPIVTRRPLFAKDSAASRRRLDYVGGLADLDAGVIRAIGDPHRRFEEDQLRLLRAVRFAARFGFALEAATAAAIRDSGRTHSRRQPRARPRRTHQNAHRRPGPPRL